MSADRPYLDHAPALDRRVRSAHGSWSPPELPAGTVIFTPQAVVAAVARAFGFHETTILGPSKEAHVSEARDVCFWLLRRHSRLPLKQLGLALNRRDHSTPLRAVVRCEERRMRDTWFRGVTDKLERELEEKARAA